METQDPQSLLAEYDALEGDRAALRAWLDGLGQGDSRALAGALGKRMLDKATEDERRKRR